MLEVKEIFPPKSEIDRIAKQLQWQQMYHSEYIYNKIISVNRGKGSLKKVDPLVPIPATISEISSDLLFGEFPKLNFQNDGINDRVIKSPLYNQLQTDLLEAAVYTSAIGTVFWKLFKVDGKVFWEFIPANRAIWFENIFGIEKIMFFELIEVKDNKKIKVYQIQCHMLENGQYVIRDYKIDVSMVDKRIKLVYDLEETKPEGMDFIPIIKILNIGQLGTPNGKSDYQGIEQLVAQVDNRFDQNNYVLQENAEPIKAVPPGFLDKNGNIRRNFDKIYEKATGVTDMGVDVVTWDGSLGASFMQIEKMIEAIFFTRRISPPIAGLDKGGNVESGRALKWRSVTTTSMINRKRKYFGKAVKQFFIMLEKMDAELKGIKAENLVIEWQDGLPMDDESVVDIVVRRVMANLISKSTAIQKLDEVDTEQAQAELDAIKAELSAEADIKAKEIPITL